MSSGFQSVQCKRSLARSQVMSDATEKCAGAGEDPKGSRLSNTPIGSPSASQMAMHFAATLDVVWRRR